MPLRHLLAMLTVAAVALPATQAFAQDWPRWRGQRFDGTAATGRGIFSQPFELRVRWKKGIGTGYSAIAIADGHAVTMASSGGVDYLIALDANSGDEQWRLALGSAFPARDGSTGGPVSTPAIADGTVFAIGPHGDFVAVDLATGRQRWKRSLVSELNAVVPHWGITTSPLVTGPNVIVLTGGAEGAITAFNRANGEVVWRAGADGASYQSPMLASVAGAERLVVAGDQHLFALDPATGREVWRHAHGGQGFYGLIINPVVTAPDKLLLTYRPDSSVLLDTAGAAPAEAWTTRELKLNYGTPVVHDGLVYGYSGAFITAIDAGTGALVWRSRAPGDGFVIVVDDRLVVMTKAGTLYVAEPGREGFRPRASVEVFDRLGWTPPAFANGCIFVRDSYESIAAVDVVPITTMSVAAPGDVDTRGVIARTSFARWVADTEAAPDAQQRVDAFLSSQASFPVLEGERYAHVLYAGEPGEILLKSDAFEFGDDVPLRRVGGTNLYYASLELEPDARIAYQFVRGLGDPFPDPRNPLQGTSLSYAGPVSLLFMPRADTALVAPAEGGPQGRFVEHEIEVPVVRAENLRWGGKRKLSVYLPPGYDGSDARYSVIYVLYGDEMREARIDAVLEREAQAGRPAIAVFVSSTSAYEYARTFRAEHRGLLVKTIVPYIDERYRTTASAEGRVLAGADEAAFAAVETAIHHPSVFGGVIAQSAFPLSSGGEELLAMIAGAPVTAQRFHVDWGMYDPRRRRDLLDVPSFTARVADALKARGFTVTGRGWDDGSVLELWADRFADGLRAVVPAVDR